MGKKLWIPLVAFIAGILAANALGAYFLMNYGIFNECFLTQYRFCTVDRGNLFVQILMERSRTVVFLLLLGKLMDRKLFAAFVKGTVAFSFGFLMVGAIASLGMKGVVVLFCGMFPQWFFYLTALFFLINRKPLSFWGRSLIFIVLVFLGSLCEGYLNPLFLKKVLNFF